MRRRSKASVVRVVALVTAVLLGRLEYLPAQQDSMHQGGKMHETMMPHGKFTGAHDHTTTGGYEIVMKDGQQVLVLGDDFVLDNAPDPYVVLSPNAMGAGTGALNLGRLRKLKGSSEFRIPAGTDLSQFTKVLIWCKRYDVTLGAADLGAPAGEMMHK